MGKPIKERGIHWVETYGDKSSYLKTEMEEQVGPGSYFRWEGHDGSTGNDYYVVIAPGYSKNHGYHFFAGLRKMPADHGASGKKFKNMRSALYYAYDTWKVPKPESMPPGWVGYDLGDISGKDIVTEGVHASSGKPVKTAVLTILSPSVRDEMERESMAVQTMAGDMVSHRMGSQILAQQYCFAYKATPVMGFLPALYSTMRVMGLDGNNFDKTQHVENRLSPETKVPVCPMISTCQPPTPEDFQKYYDNGVEISERLYDMPSAFERNSGLYATFKDPFESETGDVRTKTWGEMAAKVYLRIPAKVYDESFVDKWKGDLSLRPRFPEKERRNSDTSDYDYEVTVTTQNMDFYQKFLSDLTSMVQRADHSKALPSVEAADAHGKNFIRLWQRAKQISSDNPLLARQYGIENGFRDDQPCLQSMRVHGSQMLDYDANGLPMKIIAQAKTAKPWKQEEKVESVEGKGDTEPIYYVLKDRVEMVDRNVPGFAEAWKNADRKRVRFLLERFHNLADRNQLQMPPTASDVVDHRTTGPVISNPEVTIPMVNNYKLPVGQDGKALSPQDISELDGPSYHKVPMISESKVNAHMLANNSYAARWFDPSAKGGKGGMVYDDVDNLSTLREPTRFEHDGNGNQTINGVPTIVNKSALYKSGKIKFRVKVKGKRASIRFDGRITDQASKDLEDAGYQFKNVKSLANGEWVGKFSKLPESYRAEEGKTTGIYTFQRGETTLYDPDSKGNILPGPAYDVMYAPPLNEMLKAGMPSGFGIKYLKHKAVFNPESYLDPSVPELDTRQYSHSPFITTVPEDEDKALVGKHRGNIAWKDSLAGFNYIRKKLQIPDELAFPFTGMTDMDLKVIKDRADAGKRTYEQYKDQEVVPQEIKDLYEYGRVMSECSEKGKLIPPEVFQTLAGEMSNPEEALKPKEAREGQRDSLMALMVVPEDVNPQEAYQNPGSYYLGSPDHVLPDMQGNNPVLAPNYKKDLNAYDEKEIDSLFPGSHRLRSLGFTLLVNDFKHTSGRSFSQPSMATNKDENPKAMYGTYNFSKYLGVQPVSEPEEPNVPVEDIKEILPIDTGTGEHVPRSEMELQGESPSPIPYGESVYATPEEIAESEEVPPEAQGGHPFPRAYDESMYATPEEIAKGKDVADLPPELQTEMPPEGKMKKPIMFGKPLIDLRRNPIKPSNPRQAVSTAKKIVMMARKLRGRGMKAQANAAIDLAKKLVGGLKNAK